ncbi:MULTISPECIES: GNAT family N-acetyltransferase [Calothrix]|uniref:GNAT family N-acetyltransferase n=2 Tax=Calothrix TaxID=1186 RepID=A0ABR8A9E4_9CYAN|nr:MULTISPECIES: GNAT family N-acetyltransferase [Calothrix]MBD2196449.1 GNAT family N-acetyltransferase [Calothrix parietina FACHB-288]MBD2224656.1 GNAT family N-acetyltransferase [Calothrix anomala FACHB-343]
MPLSHFDRSDLIIRKATVQDLRKKIIESVNYCIVILISILIISFFIISYFADAWILLIVFILPLILALVSITYNLGRLQGKFPIQPREITSWVAIYQGKVIGWVDINTQKDYSILENIRIKPNLRRKRIGYLLIQTLSHEIIKPLYVQSSSHSVAFYESLGFTEVSQKDLPNKIKECSAFSLRLKDMVLK